MKRLPFVLTFVLASVALAFAQTGKRPLSLDDLGQLKDVRDPQCAPDGKSVAFVVSQIDVKEDKPGSGHIWTIGLDGRNERQITSSTDSESNPRFSPDGKYLSFTSSRPGKAGELAAAWSVSKPFQPSPPRPIPQPEGGGDRNAIPLYKFPSRVTHHFIPEMPIRVSALRALGAYTNVFSIESFMDELAAAAKADPVEYRLRHIDDARARDVIRMAAERFGWENYQKQNGRGRGFGFARYKNLAAYCALAMEVKVDRETGDLRVLRVVAAVDSGEAVNPDGIRNQIEGGILQSVSWTSFEAVMYNDTRITSRDWGTYPILRFSHVPQALEVHLIDRPGQPFLGTGEASQGPTAAALANAVADATGVRFRQLPLSRARIRTAADAT